LIDDSGPVARIAAVFEDRQVDPLEARIKARAPDDVGYVQNGTILQNRSTVSRARDPRHTRDASFFQRLRLNANERPTMRENMRASPAADRRIDREHAVKEEPQH